jgi:hypothetical protein
MVLHQQPPFGTAEAEWALAKAQVVVEYRAHYAGGYLTTRAAEEDQGPSRGRTEGRTCGLQLHEEEGAAVDGSQYPSVPVYG